MVAQLSLGNVCATPVVGLSGYYTCTVHREAGQVVVVVGGVKVVVPHSPLNASQPASFCIRCSDSITIHYIIYDATTTTTTDPSSHSFTHPMPCLYCVLLYPKVCLFASDVLFVVLVFVVSRIYRYLSIFFFCQSISQAYFVYQYLFFSFFRCR